MFDFAPFIRRSFAEPQQRGAYAHAICQSAIAGRFSVTMLHFGSGASTHIPTVSYLAVKNILGGLNQKFQFLRRRRKTEAA